MATPASSVRQPAGRQHVQRILVVDDRPTTREILELALQRLGYRAVGATGGKEALTLLSSDSFDLVISDLLMPRMSGLELLGEIRRRYTRTELPVIILTVMEEGDELVAALKGGANDYVTKPINYPVLLARLETQLSLRGSVRDVERARTVAEARSDALEQANRELDAFAGALSRDLRAPLSRVEDQADQLMRNYGGRLDARARQHLSQIAESSQRMRGLLEDLSHLAEAAHCDIALTAVDLTEVVTKIWAQFSDTRGDSGPRLTVSSGLTTRADPFLTTLLVRQLLDNAWKFAGPRNDTRVDIGLMVRDGRRVFYVADNGIGFDPIYRERVLRPFERAHERNEFPGAGVGLAIAQKIVHRHGGTVWLESQPGTGTTVFFTLEPKN